MFNIFKRVKAKPEKDFNHIVEQVQRLIEAQIATAQGKAAHQRVFDVYACGYIFGFADALLTKAGVDGDMQAKLLILKVFTQLFGKDMGQKVIGLCLRMQLDHDFVRARASGASEAASWQESQGREEPFELTEYLNNGINILT